MFKSLCGKGVLGRPVGGSGVIGKEEGGRRARRREEHPFIPFVRHSSCGVRVVPSRRWPRADEGMTSIAPALSMDQGWLAKPRSSSSEGANVWRAGAAAASD